MGGMSSMTEGIIMVLLFVLMLTSILAVLNEKFGKNYDIGLDTSGLQDFASSVDSSYDESGGEIEQTDEGLSLLSSWKMAKGILQTIYDFITGSWIQRLIVDVLKIGDLGGYKIGMMVAISLRALFILVLIVTIITLFFKVKP